MSRLLNLLGVAALLLVAGVASAQTNATTIFVETGGLDTRSGTAPQVNTGQVYQGRIVGPVRTITRALELLNETGYNNVSTISIAGGEYNEDVDIDDAQYDVDGVSFMARLESDNAETVVDIQGQVTFSADNLTFGSGTEGSFLIGRDDNDDNSNEGLPGNIADEEDFSPSNDRLITFEGGSVELGAVTYAQDADVYVTGGRATGSVTPLGSVDIYYELNRSYTAGAELPAVLDYQSGQFSSLIVELNDGQGDPDSSDLDFRIPNGVRFTDGLGSAQLDNFVYLVGDVNIVGEITVDGQVDFFAESQTGTNASETYYANFGDIVVNGEADFTLDQNLNDLDTSDIREVDNVDNNGTLLIDDIRFRVLGDFDNDGDVESDGTYFELAGDEDAVFSPGPNFDVTVLSIGNGRFTSSINGEFEGEDKFVAFTDDVTIDDANGYFYIADDAEAALQGQSITLTGSSSFAVVNGTVSSNDNGALEFAADDGSSQFIAGVGTLSNLVVSTQDPGSDFGPDLQVLPLGSFALNSQFQSGGDTDLEFTGTIALATAGINIRGEDFLGTSNGADLSPAEDAAQTATVVIVMTDPNQDTIIKSENQLGGGVGNLEGTFNFASEQFSLNYQGDIDGDYDDNPFEVGLEFDTENLIDLTVNGAGILDASGVTANSNVNTDEGRIRGNLRVTSTDPTSGAILSNLDLNNDGDGDSEQSGGTLMTLVLPVDDVPDPTDDDANTVVDGTTFVGPDAEIALLGGSTLRLRGDAEVNGLITGGSDYLDADLGLPSSTINNDSQLILEDNTVSGNGFLVLENDDAGLVIDGNVTIGTLVKIGVRNDVNDDFQTDVVDSGDDNVLTLGTGATASNGSLITMNVFGNVDLDGSLTLGSPVALSGDADDADDMGGTTRSNLFRVGDTLALGPYNLFIAFDDSDDDDAASFVDLTTATVTATSGYLWIASEDQDNDGNDYRTRLLGDDTDIPNVRVEGPTEINGGVRVTEILRINDVIDTEAGNNQLSIADDALLIFDDAAQFADLDGDSDNSSSRLAYDGGVNLRTAAGSTTSTGALEVAFSFLDLGATSSDDPNVYTFGNAPGEIGSIYEVIPGVLSQQTLYVRDEITGNTQFGAYLNPAGHRLYTPGDVTVTGNNAIVNIQQGSVVQGRGSSANPISEIGFSGSDDASFNNPSGETLLGSGVDIRIAKEDMSDVVMISGGALAFDDAFDSIGGIVSNINPGFQADDELLILQGGVLMAGTTDDQSSVYLRLDHENALNLGSSIDNGQGFVFTDMNGAIVQDDQAVEFPMSYVSGNVRKRVANADVDVVVLVNGTPVVLSLDIAPGRVIFPTGEMVDEDDESDYAPFVFDFESAGAGEEFGTRTLSVTYVDETPGMNSSLPLASSPDGPANIEGVVDFYWLVRTVGAALGQDTRFNIEARSDEYEITGSSDDIELIRRQSGDVATNAYSGIGGDADVFQIDEDGSDDGDSSDDSVVVQESVTQSFLGPQGTIITFGLAVSTRPVANTPDSPTTPTEFAFHGNMPNPFNARTALTFDLPEAAEVTVEVFDVMGRRVLNVDGKAMNAGAEQRIELDGSGLASGVYVFRMRAEGASQTWTQAGQITLAR